MSAATTMRSATFLGVVALLVLVPVAPASAADRDGDGLRDGFEKRWGVTSPYKRDSDGDGVIDSAEDNDHDRLSNLGEQRFGTDPGSKDSDGDGRGDGGEDADHDGRSNALEQDQRPIPAGLRPSLTRAPDDHWLHQDRCVARVGTSVLRRCHFGNRKASITVVVVGDSKARMLMPAVIGAATREGWHVISLLKGACSPILGTINKGRYEFDRGRACRRWRRNVIDWLGARPRAPDLIVYAHSSDYALINAKGGMIAPGRKPGAWAYGLTKTIAALPRSSAVLVLGDVARNKRNPITCLRRHTSNMSACVTRRVPPTKRTIEIALRKAARNGGATFRSLQGRVCTYDPCPLVQGNVLMWRDRSHLTTTFSKRLAPSVRAFFRYAISTGR